MIIDWQHHYMPEKLWLKRGGRKGEVVHVVTRGNPSLTLYEQLYRLDMQIADMDRAGIDMAVLSVHADCLEDAELINDSLYRVMQEYPKRFVGLATVPPLGGKAALSEIERAVSVLGLPGVAIRSQIDGLSLDAPALRPFYEKINELDVPIFVHVAGALQGYDALESPYDLHRNIGREFDLVTATTRLIFGGVLDDFPNLRFIIAHFGGGISALVERSEYWQSREPIPGIRLCKKPFREYLNMLYFDTAGFTVGIRALQCALTTINPQHMLFATDYPYIPSSLETMKPYVDAIRALDLDEETKEGILGRNAVKLLKIANI
ncbi:amidohydrolase family protein [Thermodesulfobacteriota bacterium]